MLTKRTQSSRHHPPRRSNIVHTSDSLETILSHLSARVMNAISDGRSLHHLRFLLEFLAAWEKRPVYLTPMAYQWCSTISEVARRLNGSGIRSTNTYFSRLQPQTLAASSLAEREFSEAGARFDSIRLGATSHYAHGPPRRLHSHAPAYFLSMALEIGFRHAVSSRDQSALRLDHTSHHKWVLETAFSSGDDEIIADAVGVWIVCGDSTPPGSCAHYFARRMERDTPFSPRLRQASIYVIDRIWDKELEGAALETIRWLNYLKIDVDDVVDEYKWGWRLVAAIRSPMGPESLASHYWRLLYRLIMASKLIRSLTSRDTEVMRSLEKAGEWEKLGVWMVVVWSFLPGSTIPNSESMESIKEVTLKVLLRQPSALLGFENLCEAGSLSFSLYQNAQCRGELQKICNQERAEQIPSEPSPPP